MDYEEKLPQKNDQLQLLKNLLDQNMSDFHASLLSMDKETIISKSAEITAMTEANAFMQCGFIFEPGDVDVLLRMENPLKFVADQWPSDIAGLLDMGEFVGEAIEEVKKAPVQRRQEPAMPEKTKDPQAERPSVREQLRSAAREASQHPRQADKPRGGDTR